MPTIELFGLWLVGVAAAVLVTVAVMARSHVRAPHGYRPLTDPPRTPPTRARDGDR